MQLVPAPGGHHLQDPAPGVDRLMRLVVTMGTQKYEFMSLQASLSFFFSISQPDGFIHIASYLSEAVDKGRGR